MKSVFLGPAIVALLGLGVMYAWGGTPALVLTAILAVLEITLSFDNAIINTKIISKMSTMWQLRALTWGMLVSVGAVRLLFPVLIVSATAAVSPLLVAKLALFHPAQYAPLVAGADPVIKAFGGCFLLLVALKFFFDETKEVHWLRPVERRAAWWGQVEAIEIAIVLGLLLSFSYFSGDGEIVLISGITGIVLFILSDGLTRVLGVEGSVAHSGVMLFIYLNVLDAAFSLDGVIGAFAITNLVPVITVGLGIGAYFVRSLTIAFARRGTLTKFIYLEHGAHWAIFALALCMLAALTAPVPDWFTATIGMLIIALSYLSSRSAIGRAIAS